MMKKFNPNIHYDSGKPCLHGHTLRYVKSGHCVVCQRQSSREYQNKIPMSERSQKVKEWLEENPGRRREYSRVYGKEYRRERYWNDPEFREKLKRKSRERYRNDPELRVRAAARKKERYHTDPEFRAKALAKSNARNKRIRDAKNASKETSTE